MTALYGFSPHIFACLSGRHCMFLDLHRDRYLSVPRQAMEELAPFVDGWQMTSCDEPATDRLPSGAATALASELIAAGVLRETPAGRPEIWNMASQADCDLTGTIVSKGSSGTSLRPFLMATEALLYADWMLRTTSMLRIVRAAHDRKHSRIACGQMDWHRASQLTATFMEYRPRFPRNYRCLFDSLALIHFLSWFNLFPDWVFGVQTDPFSAHCWVQAGTRILNDHLDHVSAYTPIMTV